MRRAKAAGGATKANRCLYCYKGHKRQWFCKSQQSMLDSITVNGCHAINPILTVLKGQRVSNADSVTAEPLNRVVSPFSRSAPSFLCLLRQRPLQFVVSLCRPLSLFGLRSGVRTRMPPQRATTEGIQGRAESLAWLLDFHIF